MWIRSEIVRMNMLGKQGVGNMAMVIRYQADQNIAALESRAAHVQCNAAFSSNIITNQSKSNIDQCIDACKKIR